MTKNQSNLAQAFYAAKGTTAARLMEAIRACDLDPKVHGQDIAGFIEATGIRTPEDIPEGMIPELARHFTKARHEREEAETRTKAEAALQAASDGIMVYNENLAKGVPITNPDMLKKGAEIIKGLSIIGSAPPRQGITAETLFDFEVAEGFPVGFWNGLKIPAPGATIIGARTGQGKTSALVNIARELLGQGKRVSFVSYEMNAREIALAVTLSIMAEANTGPIASFDKNDPASYPGRRFYKPDDSAVTGGNADIYSDFFSEHLKNIRL